MLQVLEESSKSIFVPLTVGGGGGICSYTDPDSGVEYSALGGRRAGTSGRAPTRVGIGSDAVAAAEEHVRSGGVETGSTSIETISRVVISIDPERVYVASDEDASSKAESAGHAVVILDVGDNGPPGPNSENRCWYQCTDGGGGREVRPMCAVTLARPAESLGAGEIMAKSR